MLSGGISCDPGLRWHTDAQVAQTPPSATSLNQNPQRNEATVCYARPLPSTAASCLPQNDLPGVYVSPEGDEKSPAGKGPAVLLVPCHAHLHGCMDPKQTLEPLPGGYRQGDLAAARPSD